MSDIQKLNLNALEDTQKPNDKVIEDVSIEQKENTNTIEETSPSPSIIDASSKKEEAIETKEEKTFKISLDMIKKTEPITELHTEEIPVQEDAPVKEELLTPKKIEIEEEKKETITPPVNTTQEEIPDEPKDNRTHISLSSLKEAEKTIEEKASSKLKKEIIEEPKVPENKGAVDKDVHFNNYESSFKSESSDLLNKIKKFKYRPTTRVWLVGGMITSLLLVIGGLMVFFPEKHSAEIYKASIIDIYNQENTSIGEVVDTGIDTKKDAIEKESIVDDFSSNEEDDEDEDITTDKENNFNLAPEEIEKKEKLRNHLFNKYSSGR